MEDKNKLIFIGVSLVVLAIIVAAVLIPKGGGDDESSAPAQPVTKEGNLDEPTPTVEKGETASVTMETSEGTFVIVLDTENDPVTANNFAYLTEEDMHAVTSYLLGSDTPLPEPAPKPVTMDASHPGYGLYRAYCAGCHGQEGQGKPNVTPSMYTNATLAQASATNTLAVLLRGIPAQSYSQTERFAPMPSYAKELNDQQLADLVNFLRQTWAHQPSALSVDDIKTLKKRLGEAGRVPQAELPAAQRAGSFQEVESTYTPEEAQREAQRCLNCGMCCECMRCVEACKADAILHEQTPSTLELEVGAVVLTPGFDAFDGSTRGGFGSTPSKCPAQAAATALKMPS